MPGMGRMGMGGGAPDFVTDCIDNTCPECWKEGCGLNSCFGVCADSLEAINPFVETLGNAIWICGSPLAFPLIFCFPAAPHTHETSGYDMPMLHTPCKRPIMCCFATLCMPCAQWHVRRQVLGGDMSKYKLWQGLHDGPQCCARRCPGAPITIKSGTYGEQDCPNAFLCAEVTVLGGCCSLCCAFDVSRRYQRMERGLNMDPTEARQAACIGFFSKIMATCFRWGACFYCCSCCIGLCAPDSGQAQECSGQGGRAAAACCGIARTLWRGIIFTRIIGMGCMTTQMIHEAGTDWNGQPKGKAPVKQKMNRGGDDDNDSDEDDDFVEVADMKMPWDKKKNEQAPQTNTLER